MYDNTVQVDESEYFTGLLYHGYDYSHTQVWASPDRGHSPEIWDRALGWYLMALVDIFEFMPESYQAPILSFLQDLAPKLVEAAEEESGAWWLVMTQPGREGNYLESSGTAMFTYSLLKALRLGYLVDDEEGTIAKAAKKAYLYMVDNWVEEKEDGTMDWHQTVEVSCWAKSFWI
jgi:rhamnogalacturonyl hydrolase YesR